MLIKFAKSLSTELETGDIVNKDWRVTEVNKTVCTCRNVENERFRRKFYYAHDYKHLVKTVSRCGLKVYDHKKNERYKRFKRKNIDK